PPKLEDQLQSQITQSQITTLRPTISDRHFRWRREPKLEFYITVFHGIAFAFNRVTLDILSLCNGEKSLEEILATMSSRCADYEEEDVTRETLALIKRLESVGLVDLLPAESSRLVSVGPTLPEPTTEFEVPWVKVYTPFSLFNMERILQSMHKARFSRRSRHMNPRLNWDE